MYNIKFPINAILNIFIHFELHDFYNFGREIVYYIFISIFLTYLKITMS